MISALTKVLHREETNPAEFERCMTDSYRKVYGLAMRLTSNSVEAEDLVQEAFIRAFRFFHRYDRAQSFTSWMYRILTNVHIDTVRRKGRVRVSSLESSGLPGTSWEIADEKSSPEVQMMADEVDEALQFALMAMSPDFRTAVVLADVEGMAYEEIADVMKTSIGTVRSRIHRGRKQLKTYLEQRCPDRFAAGGTR